MSSDLEIRCGCGRVRGLLRGVSQRESNRVVCYCDDCQSFLHFLGRVGDVADAHGGTQIVQLSPARLQLTAGMEQLRCMRLTPKGTLRWFTECCRTPIGNTLPTRQVPFVGLVHACIEGGAGRDALDLAVGPVRARVWGRFAKGDTSRLDRLHATVPVPLMLHVAGLMLRWRLRGDQVRTPFFDVETGLPAAAPHVLSEAELAAVVRARDAAG